MNCSKCDKAITAGSALIDDKRVCVECLISKGSKSKYGNQRTEYNGRTFDSKAEAERCAELDVIKAGEGETIEYGCQPKFELGLAKIAYTADFLVTDVHSGLSHVEDVKGIEPSRFKIVRKLWKQHGKHPLVILKRSGSEWSKDIIWPIGVDRTLYATDWHCAA